MQEHTDESMPSQKSVLLQTSARLDAHFGEGDVKEPSRSTAYRHLTALNQRHSVFRGTTKRNRDIARRPRRRYGKLRPTRPGEYLIIDTTRLDVFALDPATMRWVQVELTVVMDWYTRCIVALRLTPVSTKAVDAAASFFQVFRPLPAPPSWPDYAVWPYHGIPREVLIDPDKIDRTGKRLATPPLTPDTIIVDHGKIYMSEHLNSVCQRMGISIQPARLQQGSDKAPLERFFGTVREGLLQYLPGYKGPDINARGLEVEGHAFFYINELEAILREWVATVYHHRKHASLFDPRLPAARMTPAQMFAHGIARAGHIEVPRDPHLAYEFLVVEPRTIHAKGVIRKNLLYKGDVLTELGQMKSPYEGKFTDKWPIHVDPDDISRVYIRHPDTREWHVLVWEHACEVPVPFSDEGLRFARDLIFREHGFVDDVYALRELLKRWNLSMGVSPAERRMALRMSRDEHALSKQVDTDDAQAVLGLPSVAALKNPEASDRSKAMPSCGDSEQGDDDDVAELEDDYDEDEGFDWS
jgi:transposase InsO family protein